MKKNTTNCAYCDEEFTGTNRKMQYCSTSCRVMASRIRIAAKYAEQKKYKSYFESENQKLHQLSKELKAENKDLSMIRLNSRNSLTNTGQICFCKTKLTCN